jgi:hypothetical protein
LRRQEELALDVERCERVWGKMQRWALELFGDELYEALKGHMDARGVGTEERPANDDDLSVALCWLLIDRELADGGGTPAQRYTELPDIAEAERALARRVTRSRLGLHRVRDVAPGEWIDLEDVLSGAEVRVASPNVSQEAVRWHVLLCRVMTGGPYPSLWGGAAFYEPNEEPELLGVLERIARDNGLGTGRAALEEALRVGAGELVCFVPPSRRVEKVPYTLEGDPVVLAEASWQALDPARVIEGLSRTPGLVSVGETDDGEGTCFHWLVPRRDLVARRRSVPAGAVVFENGPVVPSEGSDDELEDVTSLGQFILRGERLSFSCMSEARAEAAVALVEERLGDRVSEPTCCVRSLEEVRSISPTEPEGPSRGGRSAGPSIDELLSSVLEQRLVRQLVYRRLLDDPMERFGGLSPRAAAASGRFCDELEQLVRSLEHHSALERADRTPGPEVAWLRTELGLDAEPLAV